MSIQPTAQSGTASVVISGGLPGQDGTSVILAAGAPGASIGADGDSYIDITDGEVWSRAAGVWTDTGFSIGAALVAAMQQIANLAAASAAAAAASAADAARSTLFLPSLDYSDPRNSFYL